MSFKRWKKKYLRHGKTPQDLDDAMCGLILSEIAKNHTLLDSLFESDSPYVRQRKRQTMLEYLNRMEIIAETGEQMSEYLRKCLLRKITPELNKSFADRHWLSDEYMPVEEAH